MLELNPVLLQEQLWLLTTVLELNHSSPGAVFLYQAFFLPLSVICFCLPIPFSQPSLSLALTFTSPGLLGTPVSLLAVVVVLTAQSSSPFHWLVRHNLILLDSYWDLLVTLLTHAQSIICLL